MKKSYQEPELIINIFNVEDVIMVDGGGGTGLSDDNELIFG